jgi:hypothetical protein
MRFILGTQRHVHIETSCYLDVYPPFATWISRYNGTLFIIITSSYPLCAPHLMLTTHLPKLYSGSRSVFLRLVSVSSPSHSAQILSPLPAWPGARTGMFLPDPAPLLRPRDSVRADRILTESPQYMPSRWYASLNFIMSFPWSSVSQIRNWFNLVRADGDCIWRKYSDKSKGKEIAHSGD